MSKHFISVLQLVPKENKNEISLGSTGEETLTVNHTPGSRTVALPRQPRPLPYPSSESQLSFSFDRVFDEHQSLSANYRHSVKEVVESVLLGYHGTVVTFGTQETQDMKTNTLRDSKQGIIRKATEQIFRCLVKSRRSKAHSEASSNLVMFCSFVIIINENVHDLLFGYSPDGGSIVNTDSFGLRNGSAVSTDNQDLNTMVHVIPPKLSVVNGSVSRASHPEVKSAAKVASLLSYGRDMEKKVLDAYITETNKTGGISTSPNHIATVANSLQTHHLICTITVEYAQFGTMNAPVSGDLSFVEVASSDPLSSRQKYIKGDHISKEMVSLFNFADTINSLTPNLASMSSSGSSFNIESESTESPFVPSVETAQLYGQSILTQTLKESLGGNCKTLLISFIPTCVSLDKCAETLEMLHLSSRARFILNNPNKKDLAEKALMSAYMRRLRDTYGRAVSAKEETLKPQKKKIVLTPVASPIKASLPPSIRHEMGTGDTTMSGSKDSILSDDIDTAYSKMIDVTQREERQRCMEMAASALVAATLDEGDRGEDENEEEEDERTDNLDSDTSSGCEDLQANEDSELSSSFVSSSQDGKDDQVSHTRKTNMLVKHEPAATNTPHARPVSTKVKLKRNIIAKTDPLSTASASHDNVSVGVLIGILQDPDTGALRPSVSDLANVQLRNDVGAIFSGASIVTWLITNVDGVRNEREAVSLGQVLLDKGALGHSEGSMVFANAETLFYYAKQSRPSRRTLSPLEIRSLLAQANITSSLTLVGPSEATGMSFTDMAEKGHCVTLIDGVPLDNTESTESRTGSKTQSPSLRSTDNGGYNENIRASTNSASGRKMTKSPLHAKNGDIPVPPFEEADFDHPSQSSTLPLDNTQLSRSLPNPSTVSGSLAFDVTAGVSQADSHEREEAELLKTQEEEMSEPNTAPVEHIPTVQTLESTVNYPHPLHMAAAIGKSPGVIRELVMMFGVSKLDDFKRTPLMFAALGNNKKSSCSTLIEFGANTNHQDNSGLTALHVACYHGNRAAANVLLNKGGLVDVIDATGHSALHWSTVPENHSCLQLIMRHAWPELVVHTDGNNLTALHWAIYFNRPQHLASLIMKCSDPGKLDSEGRTLVTYALEKGKLSCLQVLINTHPFLLSHPDANNSCPLHHASAQASPRSLLMLLTHNLKKKDSTSSLDINCTNMYQRTPLHCAVAYSSEENVSLLMSKGADVEALDKEGKTPIHYAKELENGDNILAILEGHVTLGTPPPQMSNSGSPQTSSQQSAKVTVSTTTSSGSDSSRVCVIL